MRALMRESSNQQDTYLVHNVPNPSNEYKTSQNISTNENYVIEVKDENPCFPQNINTLTFYNDNYPSSFLPKA